MTQVKDWPAYLLVGIPEALQGQLSEEAKSRNLSLNEVMREILCTHYRTRCPQRGSGYRKPSTDRILLRLPPRVWEKIKAETSGYGEIKALIVRVLEAHYA